MEQNINIVGGAVYPSYNRRPVGKYGGRYVRNNQAAVQKYTTFTNTPWRRRKLSGSSSELCPEDAAVRRSLLFQAPPRQRRENFIPKVEQSCTVNSCSASGSASGGECGEVIGKILSKFANDLSSPTVFGPPAWFTYHNGSAHLPENLNSLQQLQMYGFVQGIPLMTPCSVCQPHATKYITENDYSLREAVKTRDGMFSWFVDFHNAVNARHGKTQMTLNDAKTLYRIDNQCTVSS